MTSPDEPTPDPKPKNNIPTPERKLPAELSFLSNLPDFDEMEDDERIAFIQGYLEKVRTHRELIREQGIDPDAVATEIEGRLNHYIKACLKEEAGIEALLQATASAADAKYALFKALEANICHIEKHNPFHPEVQEWREFLEEMRKQMPKE